MKQERAITPDRNSGMERAMEADRITIKERIMAGTIHHLDGQIDQIARPPITTCIRISRGWPAHRVTAFAKAPTPPASPNPAPAGMLATPMYLGVRALAKNGTRCGGDIALLKSDWIAEGDVASLTTTALPMPGKHWAALFTERKAKGSHGKPRAEDR